MLHKILQPNNQHYVWPRHKTHHSHETFTPLQCTAASLLSRQNCKAAMEIKHTHPSSASWVRRSLLLVLSDTPAVW